MSYTLKSKPPSCNFLDSPFSCFNQKLLVEKEEVVGKKHNERVVPTTKAIDQRRAAHDRSLGILHLQSVQQR